DRAPRKLPKSVSLVHRNCDNSQRAHKFVILSEAKDLMHPAGVGKFVGLSLHSDDKVLQNPAQVSNHAPLPISEKARGERWGRRYDSSRALSIGGRGPRILLKLRYLRRSSMFTVRKLALTLAFTVLVALAFGVSCRGFFPANSLLSIAVQPPSPNVVLGQTTKLQAWGTYQNNSGQTQIKSGVAWSSDTPAVLSIDETTGVATGNSLGTATVTASAQGLSAT